jgi:copper chaperone CopZ
VTGQVCTLKVWGMICGACAAQVEKVAKKIDGVAAAKVSQPKGTAEITYDGEDDAGSHREDDHSSDAL